MIFYIRGKYNFQFPVNPASFQVSAGGNSFNDVQVLEKGEITVIGDKQLSTVTFSSFFPRDYDEGFCSTSDIPDPYDAVRKIERMRLLNKPVRLIISGTDVNMSCTIRQFDHEERGGEPGDVYFTIQFKEYRTFSTRTIVDNSVKKVESARPSEKTQPKTYTVVKGDSLWAISEKFGIGGANYKKLYDANQATIDSKNKGTGNSKNTIYPGQVFTIP